MENCNLGLSSMIGALMAVGGSDLLCILPRHKIKKYGIPYLRFMLEVGASAFEKLLMDKFWTYF